MINAKPHLPPIINEDDGELPFLKQDLFSDVTLIVCGKKLFTARCMLAYNSPVFQKLLTNAKKQDIDMSDKNYDDMVELLCYLDPRVQYTVTAQSAKQLLPLAEEYEIYKLRRVCEKVLFTAYEQLRREHKLGKMPGDTNEEYLVIADRYRFDTLLSMCIDEYVYCSNQELTKTMVNLETVSESVKLMILQRKLERLNSALEQERRYKHTVECNLDNMSPKKMWTNKFGLY